MKNLIKTGIGTAAVAVASLAPWAGVPGVAQTPAGSSTRYVSVSSTDTTGPCTQAAPCDLGHAISAAASGDRVVVGPGDYHVTSPLRATVPIDISGEPGKPFPRIIGDPEASPQTLQLVGGSVSRLYIETAAPDAVALDLVGGVGEQLILVGSGGDHEAGAVGLASSAAGTVLRDSVARVVGAEGETVELRDGAGGAGAVKLVNVTVDGGSNTTALESRASSATVINSIVRGGARDLKVGAGTLNVSYSNFRPASSAGQTDGGHNQLDAPLFVDQAAGDYHLRTGSPAIDAGTNDPLAGAGDLDGNPRTAGPAVDIGAYEHQLPASGSSATPPASQSGSGPAGSPPAAADVFTSFATGNQRGAQGVPAPSLSVPPLTAGESFAAASASGSANVRLPGSDHFVALSPSLVTLPLGTTVDARSAAVWLYSARDAEGTPQGALVYGSKFRIRQSAGAQPMTEIVMAGGNYGSCHRFARTSAVAAGHRAVAADVLTLRHKHVVRRLWARDNHGRFRTHGANSVATVRGTAWRVDDRCDGTLTKVYEGAMKIRDRRTHRRVLVTAHHHYVAYR